MTIEILTALRQKQHQLEIHLAKFAAAETRASLLESDLAFWRDQEKKARSREQILRQRVLDLEAEVAKLRRQIDSLARHKAQVLVQQLVTALGQALEAGEALMPGRVISQLEAEFKGLLGVTNEGIGLRLHGTEAVPAGAFSQVRLGISCVPPSLASQMLPFVARGLERLQASLSDWPLERGADRAQELVAELSRLLGERAVWEPVAVATRIDDLTTRLERLGTELPEGPGRNRLTAAVANLTALLARRNRPTPSGSDLNAIAAALQEIARAVDQLGKW